MTRENSIENNNTPSYQSSNMKITNYDIQLVKREQIQGKMGQSV